MCICVCFKKMFQKSKQCILQAVNRRQACGEVSGVQGVAPSYPATHGVLSVRFPAVVEFPERLAAFGSCGCIRGPLGIAASTTALSGHEQGTYGPFCRQAKRGLETAKGSGPRCSSRWPCPTPSAFPAQSHWPRCQAPPLPPFAQGLAGAQAVAPLTGSVRVFPAAGLLFHKVPRAPQLGAGLAGVSVPPEASCRPLSLPAWGAQGAGGEAQLGRPGRRPTPRLGLCLQAGAQRCVWKLAAALGPWGHRAGRSEPHRGG